MSMRSTLTYLLNLHPVLSILVSYISKGDLKRLALTSRGTYKSLGLDDLPRDCWKFLVSRTRETCMFEKTCQFDHRGDPSLLRNILKPVPGDIDEIVLCGIYEVETYTDCTTRNDFDYVPAIYKKAMLMSRHRHHQTLCTKFNSELSCFCDSPNDENAAWMCVPCWKKHKRASLEYKYMRYVEGCAIEDGHVPVDEHLLELLAQDVTIRRVRNRECECGQWANDPEAPDQWLSCSWCRGSVRIL